MKRNTLLIVIVLSLLLLLSGCLTDLKATLEVEESGSGHVVLEIKATDDIQKEIQGMLGDRKNLEIEKQKVPDTESSYTYTIKFDFDDVSDLSSHATFETFDKGDNVEFVYEDIWSPKTITGKDESIVDFDVCVKMPGEIAAVRFDGATDTSYTGKKIACEEIDGSKSNAGQAFYIKSQREKTCAEWPSLCAENEECVDSVCVRKKGCAYDNPRCAGDQDCVGNNCVLKRGCDYNNPPCGSNQNCIDNACKLKEGCDYENPPCKENEECTENECVVVEQPVAPFLLLGGVVAVGGILVLAVIVVLAYLYFRRR